MIFPSESVIVIETELDSTARLRSFTFSSAFFFSEISWIMECKKFLSPIFIILLKTSTSTRLPSDLRCWNSKYFALSAKTLFITIFISSGGKVLI